MDAQNVQPHRRAIEDEQDAILSKAAALLIKGVHRAGPDMDKADYALDLTRIDRASAPSERDRLEKMDNALFKIASIDNTPKVTVDDVLAAQIPKLKQSPLPGGVGDHLNANITPINGNDMSALSDAAIAEIIEYGLEALPSNPDSSDYSRFASTRAARTEQMKRAMRPTSGRTFVTGPTTVA